MTTDRNGLEVLDADECFRLLRGASIGRIAITSRALPVILPINYRLDSGRILFRTSPGTKLDAATHNAVVAFEVDDVDPLYHSGWSVLVTGVAQDATAQLPDDTKTATPRWAPGQDERVVAISIDQISGRRLELGAHTAWDMHDAT